MKMALVLQGCQWVADAKLCVFCAIQCRLYFIVLMSLLRAYGIYYFRISTLSSILTIAGPISKLHLKFLVGKRVIIHKHVSYPTTKLVKEIYHPFNEGYLMLVESE